MSENFKDSKNLSFINAETNFESYIKHKNLIMRCKLCRKLIISTDHSCSSLKDKKRSVALNLQKHCGVLNIENEPCFGPLTCRNHNLEEKRNVQRFFNLDILFKLQKKKKKEIKEKIEIDGEIREIIDKIEPVVVKNWHNVKFKYESLGMKNLFFVKRRSDNQK
ncbi:hypothetical protein GVAV_002655 [Gurleya vavrai]